MAYYKLSVCYPGGVTEPEPDELARIMAEVGSLNDDLKAAGAWVFGGGLHGFVVIGLIAAVCMAQVAFDLYQRAGRTIDSSDQQIEI